MRSSLSNSVASCLEMLDDVCLTGTTTEYLRPSTSMASTSSTSPDFSAKTMFIGRSAAAFFVSMFAGCTAPAYR